MRYTVLASRLSLYRAHVYIHSIRHKRLGNHVNVHALPSTPLPLSFAEHILLPIRLATSPSYTGLRAGRPPHLRHRPRHSPPPARGAPCERVPCGDSSSAVPPLSRSRIHTSAFYRPADPGCVRAPVFGGVLRRPWTCTQRAQSVSYLSTIDTLPRSRAGALHASQEPAPSCARRPSSIFGKSQVRPVYTHSSSRTATSMGYEGAAGAYVNLDESLITHAPLFHPPIPHSALLFPSALLPSPPRSLFTSMHNTNTLPSQPSARRGQCSFRPSTTSTGNATFPLSPPPATTTRIKRSTRAQSTNIATLRTKARPNPSAALRELRRAVCLRAPLHHHQFFLGGSTAHAGQGHPLRWKWAAVSWVSGDLLPVFSSLVFFDCGDAEFGILSCTLRCERFCGAGISLRGRDVVLRGGRGGPFFDALYPLRVRPVWALCPCPSSFSDQLAVPLPHALAPLILPRSCSSSSYLAFCASPARNTPGPDAADTPGVLAMIAKALDALETLRNAGANPGRILPSKFPTWNHVPRSIHPAYALPEPSTLHLPPSA
ncbi:hypothetical protein B0H13DRAFT_2679149 [Mycena leptocephala]|nr:hypothetical protein B0H13DRAFT_2679149 [Mycena leptocephala]